MFLKKISLKNIRSYESAEIEFSQGSTLLSGDIGSGKTSVLLAIEFALFGLQPGQKGASLLKNNADLEPQPQQIGHEIKPHSNLRNTSNYI